MSEPVILPCGHEYKPWKFGLLPWGSNTAFAWCLTCNKCIFVETRAQEAPSQGGFHADP